MMRTVEEAPHPCTENPELEACVALAQEVAETAAVETGSSLKEALVANAPAITEKLNSALGKVGEWVEATESFAMDQTPLLIREIIYFEVASNGFWLLVGVVGILWGWFAWRWSHHNALNRLAAIEAHDDLLKFLGRKMHKSTTDTCDVVFSFSHYAVPISGIATTVLGVIFVFANVMDVLKPLVAPRLFLIEYFRGLVG